MSLCHSTNRASLRATSRRERRYQFSQTGLLKSVTVHRWRTSFARVPYFDHHSHVCLALVSLEESLTLLTVSNGTTFALEILFSSYLLLSYLFFYSFFLLCHSLRRLLSEGNRIISDAGSEDPRRETRRRERNTKLRSNYISFFFSRQLNKQLEGCSF